MTTAHGPEPSAPRALHLITDSPDRTRDAARLLGARLAELVQDPPRTAVVDLRGPLGAGKTVFVKGLAEGMGVATAREVTSPTFTLHQVFRRDGVTLHHLDAYRLSGPDELEGIGFVEEVLERPPAVVALEWAERVETLLPAERVRVELAPVGDGEASVRSLVVRADGPWSGLTDLPEDDLAALGRVVERP